MVAKLVKDKSVYKIPVKLINFILFQHKKKDHFGIYARYSLHHALFGSRLFLIYAIMPESNETRITPSITKLKLSFQLASFRNSILRKGMTLPMQLPRWDCS